MSKHEEAKVEALRRVNAVLVERGNRHPYGPELFTGYPSAVAAALLVLVEEHLALKQQVADAQLEALENEERYMP